MTPLDYVKLAWKALPWILILVVLAWAGILRTENNHLTATIETQAATMGKLQFANNAFATSATKQNNAVQGWLDQQAAMAQQQKSAIAASTAAAALLSQRAKDLLGLKAPTDPKQDCSAFELLLNNEIQGRKK